MKISKLAASLATAFALTVAASAASAAVVNVGGVVWDPEYSEDLSIGGTVNEQVVSMMGAEIFGYGLIDIFNDATQAQFCSGCELTYTFSGYELLNDLTNATVGDSFGFSGGILNIYLDTSPNYSILNPSSAEEGTLFLSLVGNTSAYAFLGYTNGETLVGSIDLPTANGIGGSGDGFLDVVGGIAAAYFDTNGELGGADIVYQSTFQPRGQAIDGIYTHSGKLIAQGDTQNVPEPGIIALLGLGLAGIGASRKLKKKA